MTTNETAVFISQIVHLHHSGEQLAARGILQALEAAMNLTTAGMNTLYLKIEKLERTIGFVEDGAVRGWTQEASPEQARAIAAFEDML